MRFLGFAAAAVERLGLQMVAGTNRSVGGKRACRPSWGGGSEGRGAFSLSRRRAMLIHEMPGVGFDTKGPGEPEEAALLTVPIPPQPPWPNVSNRL